MTAEPSDRHSGPSVRRGRRPSTSPHELEKVAFELFDERGFDATTVDDIARAAGIGRRTFFRYFESKNDVVWGSFTEQLEFMRQQFDACPPDQPLMEAVRTVVVDFNRVDAAEIPRHRRRMELILRVPALQAHSTLRFADWRTVVAEFVAQRLRLRQDSLLPQAIAYAALGVALAAYEHWLANADRQLVDILDRALHDLATGFTDRGRMVG